MDLKNYPTLGRTGLRVSPLCLGATRDADRGCPPVGGEWSTG